MSGYDLMKSCGDYCTKPSPGYIYPLLNDLQKKGFIVVKKDSRRKIYSLTKKVITLLNNLKIKREETVKSIAKILEPITGKSEIQKFIKSRQYKKKINISIQDQLLLKELNSRIYDFYQNKDNDKNNGRKEKMKKILQETIKNLEKLK
jgi:DNA-binding PadR family transcriptional regulator